MVASSKSTRLDNSSARIEEDLAGAELRRYQAEMQLVRAELDAMVNALEGPLRSLVRSQVKATMPPVRAAIALATGVIDDEQTPKGPQARDDLRNQRIHLAIALEMLASALNTHRLLILGDAAELDKSILGGTILAGDYCFSRSADMAVKTNSPQVVAFFATALKSVSEGSLRHLFHDRGNAEAEEINASDTGEAFDENSVLYHTAVAAAMTLTDASEDATDTLLRLATHLVAARPGADATAYVELNAMATRLPARQRVRWQYLLRWLFTSTGDGGARPIL
jgi:octaprenyl-diphosphate synthase